MKRWLAGFLVLGLLAFTGGTAVADVATAGVDRKEVQQALDKIARGGGALGVQARLTDGRDRFVARSGVAEYGKQRPVPLDGRFRVGSITKPFVSVVTLQLVAEGKVALDAPVVTYLPGSIDPRITVRQLLQHTSGLYNYTGALPFDPVGFEKIRWKSWQHEEVLALVAGKPLDFEPGTRWSYSNTGYVVAGLLVEKVTGRSLEREIDRRILTPLRLNETVSPVERVGIPGPHAHGYFTGASEPLDITRFNPSVVWAAGDLISTTADLDTFAKALTGGKLLKKPQLDEMTRTTEVSPLYGLGLTVETAPCGVEVLGHDGGLPGYLSGMYTTPDASKRLMASVNTAPAVGTGEGYQELFNAAFC